jgi:hypothetical protein
MQKKPYQPPRLRLIAHIRGGVVRDARTGELVGGFDELELELSPAADSDEAFRAVLEHDRKVTF